MTRIYWADHMPAVMAAVAAGADLEQIAQLLAGRGVRLTSGAQIRSALYHRGLGIHGSRIVPIAAGLPCAGPVTAASPSTTAPLAGAACSLPGQPLPAAGPCSTAGEGCTPAEPPRIPRDLIPPEPAPEHNVVVDGLPSSVLVISDLHVPIHDQRAVDAVLAFARDVKPGMVVIAGDCLDCWILSGFAHEAERLFDPGARLQEELDAARPIIRALRECSPRVEWMLGNHENRLARMVNLHPGLFGLRALEWERLADLPDGVTVHRYGAQLRVGAMTIVHGDRMGGRFGVIHAAAWALNRHGGRNISFGHTHRLESRCRTVWDETGEAHQYIAINTGHLSDVSQQRWTSEPDWHHGCLHLECWSEAGRPRFSPHLIPIVAGRFSYGGRAYGRSSQ